ncbi:lipopolysaccharide biosynthesis protein [Serratia marcescens]|nr:lipopolysaccharide biosynthesis protein [Serratia marcescens]BEM76841.1 lipopolysaccharide biosynthesis protein [Serratia marcescens]
MEKLKEKTTRGLKWSALERVMAQGVQLCVMLILARMLGPTSFGLVGMLAVFIAVAQVFVDSGFSAALIRKPERSEADVATTFYFNITVSLVCYAVLYFSADSVARFYNQSELSLLLKVLGLAVIFNSFLVIPRTNLTIAMDFKSQAKISILSVLVSGTIALFLAWKGYGVWALVAQTLLASLTSVVMYNIISPWKPKDRFSFESFRYLFGFGSKLLCSSLLETIYNNIYQLIIGKHFSPNYVGQFTQANQLASVPAMTATTVIQRVTFPMFSHMQSSPEKMDQAYLLTLKLAAFVIFPLLSILSVASTPLLTLVLGIKWIYASHLLSILCIGYLLYPIHAINLNILQVKGRSDLFLKLEVIKKVLGVAILLVTMQISITAMCIGIVVHSYLSLIINTYYTSQLTQIGQLTQFKALWSLWLGSVVSAASAFYLNQAFVFSLPAEIFIAICIPAVLYIMYSVLFQRDLLKIIFTAVKK